MSKISASAEEKHNRFFVAEGKQVSSGYKIASHRIYERTVPKLALFTKIRLPWCQKNYSTAAIKKLASKIIPLCIAKGKQVLCCDK